MLSKLNKCLEQTQHLGHDLKVIIGRDQQSLRLLQSQVAAYELVGITTGSAVSQSDA